MSRGWKTGAQVVGCKMEPAFQHPHSGFSVGFIEALGLSEWLEFNPYVFGPPFTTMFAALDPSERSGSLLDPPGAESAVTQVDACSVSVFALRLKPRRISFADLDGVFGDGAMPIRPEAIVVVEPGEYGDQRCIDGPLLEIRETSGEWYSFFSRGDGDWRVLNADLFGGTKLAAGEGSLQRPSGEWTGVTVAKLLHWLDGSPRYSLALLELESGICTSCRLVDGVVGDALSGDEDHDFHVSDSGGESQLRIGPAFLSGECVDYCFPSGRRFAKLLGYEDYGYVSAHPEGSLWLVRGQNYRGSECKLERPTV